MIIWEQAYLTHKKVFFLDRQRTSNGLWVWLKVCHLRAKRCCISLLFICLLRSSKRQDLCSEPATIVLQQHPSAEPKQPLYLHTHSQSALLHVLRIVVVCIYIQNIYFLILWIWWPIQTQCIHVDHMQANKYITLCYHDTLINT